MVTEIVEVLIKIGGIMKSDIPAEEITKRIAKETKYNKNIIAAAYSWIYEKEKRNKAEENVKLISGTKSFRALSNEEIDKIGINNYNYLLHFYNLRLLTNRDLEDILEELKYLPEDLINIEQINLLILSLFLDLDRLMLPGSRILLYSSDTIN